MSWEAWAAIAAIGTVVLQTIGLIIAGLVALSKNRDEIVAQINELKLETEAQLNELKLETAEKLNRISREPGETFTALRQKINEVELYIRDHFVAKDAFQAVVGQIMSDMKSIGDRIETRLLRMESKIDRVNQDGN